MKVVADLLQCVSNIPDHFRNKVTEIYHRKSCLFAGQFSADQLSVDVLLLKIVVVKRQQCMDDKK